MINIIKPSYVWNGSLSKRSKTAKIILHHAAMHGTPEEIHKLHINNGSSGMGYRFYIRQDGKIYEGRPIDIIGAHCKGHNYDSIGICFEGNFEREPEMSEEQKKAGKQVINYINSIYPNLQIYRHKDLYPTACPGRYFPFNEFVQKIIPITSVNDILWELLNQGIVTDAQKWKKKINEDKDIYWLCYKISNKLRGTLE